VHRPVLGRPADVFIAEASQSGQHDRHSILARNVAAPVTVCLTGSAPVPSAEAAVVETEDVLGGWIGEPPCPLTSAAPSAGNPTTVPFECVSGALWVAHTAHRAVGTLDLVCGDFPATVDERLTALVATIRAAGTRHRMEMVAVVGVPAAVVLWEWMVGDTGAFAAPLGAVMSVGNQVGLVSGHPGYQGVGPHR
jgi:hypothetical protein